MHMMTLVPILLLAAAIGFALFDVFWPLSIALVAGIALGWWFGKLDDNALLPHLRFWMIAPYAGIGFVWTFFKWTRFVDAAYRENRRAGPPQWRLHSYAFSAYFFWWPIDVVAYILSDLLEDVWQRISAMVAQSFDRYARWRFKGYEQER